MLVVGSTNMCTIYFLGTVLEMCPLKKEKHWIKGTPIQLIFQPFLQKILKRAMGQNINAFF